MDHADAIQFDAAIALLRIVFGVFLAVHGVNKIVGGIEGTVRWFASIGMRWPHVQARLAAATEIGAGGLLAVGLLTPVAAASIVSVMCVAIVVAHRKVGFFVFHPGQGWEYCASIITVTVAIGVAGPGRWSIDHLLDIGLDGWWGAAVTIAIGLGSAAAHLAVSYRPSPS